MGKGWLLPPIPLTYEGDPFITKYHKLNIAFRFGLDQGGKLRACDDLRHARTTLACVVATPIKLVRWGHVVEHSNLANTGVRDWAFCKDDPEAAYKQLPLDWERAELSAIALRSSTRPSSVWILRPRLGFRRRGFGHPL